MKKLLLAFVLSCVAMFSDALGGHLCVEQLSVPAVEANVNSRNIGEPRNDERQRENESQTSRDFGLMPARSFRVRLKATPLWSWEGDVRAKRRASRPQNYRSRRASSVSAYRTIP